MSKNVCFSRFDSHFSLYWSTNSRDLVNLCLLCLLICKKTRFYSLTILKENGSNLFHIITNNTSQVYEHVRPMGENLNNSFDWNTVILAHISCTLYSWLWVIFVSFKKADFFSFNFWIRVKIKIINF